MEKGILHLTEDDFKETIAHGVVLVDFFATWCGPCRMMNPVVEQLATEFEGKAKIAKLDIDEAQQVTGSLQITSVPTLILFKDGTEVRRIVGVKNFDFLNELILSQL